VLTYKLSTICGFRCPLRSCDISPKNKGGDYSISLEVAKNETGISFSCLLFSKQIMKKANKMN
jgi:hypothetical protein